MQLRGDHYTTIVNSLPNDIIGLIETNDTRHALIALLEATKCQDWYFLPLA